MVVARQRRRRLFSIVCAILFAAIPLVASDAHHVIYLHGRIVQERQDARPLHPEYGHYELEKIVAAFRDRGFVVWSEIRPKSASVNEAADRVVEQIGELLRNGVPPERITIVGASMGAGIALTAAARLRNAAIRYVVLGACLSGNARPLLEQEGKEPAGRILAIVEQSDDSTTPCPPSKSAREIVLRTGLGHGFLYRPLAEWVDPAVAWARAK